MGGGADDGRTPSIDSSPSPSAPVSASRKLAARPPAPPAPPGNHATPRSSEPTKTLSAIPPPPTTRGALADRREAGRGARGGA